MFSDGNQKIISGNLQGQALKFPSTIPQGEYREALKGYIYPKVYTKKNSRSHPMRVPGGVSYILYIHSPENHQNPCKPPSGHIIGLCIPTISLGIPQGVDVYLPSIQIYSPPGWFYEHYTPCIQFCLLTNCHRLHYLKIKLDKIDINVYNIFIYYSKDTHTRT